MSFQVLNGADESGEITPVLVNNHESSQQWHHLPFLQSWKKHCPLSFITRHFLMLELVLNIIASWVHLNNDNICLSFDRIFYKVQAYRVFVAPWFYHSAAEFASSAFAWCFIAGPLEKLLGSLLFCYILLWFVCLTGVLYTTLGLFFSQFHWPLPDDCVLGISNVLFALLVLAFSRFEFSLATLRDLPIPSWSFPWMILIACQAMIPSSPFIGHLSGVIAGTLFVHQISIIPNYRLLLKIEESPLLSWIILHTRGYIPATVALEDVDRLPMRLFSKGEHLWKDLWLVKWINKWLLGSDNVDICHASPRVPQIDYSEKLTSVIVNGNRSHPSSRSSSEGREQEFRKLLVATFTTEGGGSV
ncbi:hypothetical protein GpartN1_g6338.t1 [Galdieria partita]|uniref:Peptidase S54 rhomboid domain-containing protein n=1 Tax=Galdieria partita TaxID=83374 RepID=A0A9C7Q3H6_9RHOD|nr:hypothetical protein GpartN1_g6338.t1 [Galdieria partita]